MSLFAIGDLHLAIGEPDKTMEAFGGRWIGAWFGHAAVGQWIGLAYGVATGFYELYKTTRRLDRLDDREPPEDRR